MLHYTEDSHQFTPPTRVSQTQWPGYATLHKSLTSDNNIMGQLVFLTVTPYHDQVLVVVLLPHSVYSPTPPGLHSACLYTQLHREREGKGEGWGSSYALGNQWKLHTTYTHGILLADSVLGPGAITCVGIKCTNLVTDSIRQLFLTFNCFLRLFFCDSVNDENWWAA